MGFEDRVWGFVREKEMLKPGDRVVVALSGGADSVCLLTVLRENRMGLRLRAVHVHHGIRGNEADRDADFVRGFVGEWECLWRWCTGMCRDLGKNTAFRWRRREECFGMRLWRRWRGNGRGEKVEKKSGEKSG